MAVYCHPCYQNTNNHFGWLEKKEIRKLTFAIGTNRYQPFS